MPVIFFQVKLWREQRSLDEIYKIFTYILCSKNLVLGNHLGNREYPFIHGTPVALPQSPPAYNCLIKTKTATKNGGG